MFDIIFGSELDFEWPDELTEAIVAEFEQSVNDKMGFVACEGEAWHGHLATSLFPCPKCGAIV